MLHQTISPRWTECIVAATGPSLTEEVAEACRGRNVIAVNDAYKLIPDAQVLYAADLAWWRVHNYCPDFKGEKWTCLTEKGDGRKERLSIAEKHGLHLVQGKDSKESFSLDPSFIHYGGNSGFQSVNLSIHFGAKRILLVGFDMRVNGKRHFFGDHRGQLRNTSNFQSWIRAFESAAKRLPPEIEIINCTPGSAIKCFPHRDTAEALTWAFT